MKKLKFTQEELDKLVAERMKEYTEEHTFKIKMKYGNTYISVDDCDYIAQQAYRKLRKLLDLMDVEYLIQPPWKDDKFCFIITGEDQTRTNYIQKFIDDGYKLKWN